MIKYAVEVMRGHTQSRNCIGYIPEIECENDDDVINLPEVQACINQAYGKKMTVHVMPFNETYQLIYEIEKPKALIN